ncbi:hypothetical protein RCL1_006628 [Eukaryota sp. TZLM3-RCL]
MKEISIELDTENQRTELCNLLNNFPEVFDPHFPEQGILCEPMNEDLEDDEKNINFKARPMNPRRLKIANQIFDELIQSGIARESTQKKYQSPVVLIEYATKKPRLTGDYSGVDGINQNTKPVPANLPKLSEINGLLSSASFIATLDLPRAFYQLMVNPKDVPKTAVGIPGRSIEFLRASFGLRNVPAIFQNTMQSIFNHPSGRVFTYIDDIIIAADTFQEYLDLIEFVLAQAQKFSVRIAAPKSKFCTSNFPIKLVGNIYHKQTRSIDPDRLKAIVELPSPPSVSALRSFLGAVNFIRDYLPNLAASTSVLTELLQKNVSYIWNDSHESAFSNIKQSLIKSTSLVLPHDEAPVFVSVDASNDAIGGVVWIELPPYKPHSKFTERNLKPVSFYSKVLTKAQSKWSTIQKELFAIVKTLTQSSLENFLISRKFVLLTDHRNLTFLHSAPLTNRLVHRWLPILAQFEFSILHIDGPSNNWPDLLSRLITPINRINIINDVETNFSQRLQENQLLESTSDPEQISKCTMEGDLHLYRDKLYVPKNMRQEVLMLAHGGPLAGHPGVNNTVKCIHDANLNWPYLQKDVQEHIAHCISCEKTANISRTIVPNTGSLWVNKPFECLHIDTMGPLPEDELKNKYIFVFTDAFTRYTILVPSKHNTALDAALVLARVVFMYNLF